MSSPDETTIPLPVQLLLEQEQDEECAVFLHYDAITANDDYTTGKLVAASEITSAKYTITDKFSIPVTNIQNVNPTGEADVDISESENRLIWLGGCTEDELATLFDSVTIAYTFDTETAEVGN